MSPFLLLVLLLLLQAHAFHAQEEICTAQLLQTCSPCLNEATNDHEDDYDCSLPGLSSLTPGMYKGITVNYLSYLTQTSSPTFPIRAAEFTACTGGIIQFSEASNVWADPIADLGTATSRGSELYDGYFMSYSHFPEASSLGLAETLNERIRQDNDRLHWEDILPKVKSMGEYRKNGVTNIDFLMYDGDFFVPVVRLDLLEKYGFAVPNTWDEVVQLVQFFNGTDINDDGDPDDFGICFFPGKGGESWDRFFSEYLYSTWATFDQTHGAQQGFFFQDDSFEPRIGAGLSRAAEIWKDLWHSGVTDCGPLFEQGRCALGFAPPGCWKSVFLNGVARKDENTTVIWQPTLNNGEYAEPYRLKPFGSIEVIDRTTGQFTACSPERCPKAEKVPSGGHHGPNDRASRVLPSSLHEGKLINRAPFFWSGGLGTLIRKSAPAIKKDLMWDFFVYTNSPATSVEDITKASWLDSWRFSHLLPGDNFLAGGWSKQAYEEHAAIMLWALSNEANGAFNIRLPGGAMYTRDAVGESFDAYRQGELSLDTFVKEVKTNWNEITAQKGKLDQLDTYRASLGKDSLSQVDLCRLHRELMDARDPNVCRKYDNLSTTSLLLVVLGLSIAFVVAVLAVVCRVRRRKASNDVWLIKRSELHFSNPPKILGSGTFGLVLLAEYRGTQVAVKRVIPPRKDTTFNCDNTAKKSAMGLSSSFALLASRRDFSRDSVNDVEQTLSARETSGILPEQQIDSISEKVASKEHESRVSFGGESEGVVSDTFGRHVLAHSLFGGGRMKKSGEYEKLKQEFLLEMRQLAKLRHPSITTVMGAVLEKTHEPLLVMELMEKGSLYDLIHDKSVVLDGPVILPILRDVAQGVRFLHAADPQIVHSDLKASNILVDGRFRAKVADFGLSQNRKAGAAGTPFWMSPEILRGETGNTTESDAYAFGIILYEVYARKVPYEGELPREVLALVADEFINKRPPVPDSCPPKARMLMTECLDSDLSKRPTFEELDLQLRRMDPETMEPVQRQHGQRHFSQAEETTRTGLSTMQESESNEDHNGDNRTDPR